MGLNLSNDVADALQWVGVTLIIIGFLIGFIFYIVVYTKKSPQVTPQVNSQVSAVIPQVPKKISNVAFYSVNGVIIALLFLGLILASISTQRSPIMGPANAISGQNVSINTVKEPFGETGGETGEQIVYQNIGFGPLVSANNVNNWLNGKLPGSSSTDTTIWLDGNGDPIELPSAAFKSIYGFIPPSFEYFPDGQDTNDYNPTNYEGGRRKCMEACTLTNCTAVQTEVAQNCYHQTIPISKVTGQGDTPTEGEYVNGCLGQSSHACTLFYNNVQDADDAYWSINNYFGNGNTGGCLGVNKDGEPYIGCLGMKYYEDTSPALPRISPVVLQDGSSPKPSESPVKWCDETITELPYGSSYASLPNQTCSCTTEENCTDPGCCKWRDLLTTEHMSNKKPYYNLPVAVESLDKDQITGITKSKLAKAVNIDENGVRRCCGLCPPDEYFEGIDPINWNSAQNTNAVDDSQKVYKSCLPKRCTNSSNRNCWVIDQFAPEDPCPYTTDQERSSKCTNTLNGKYCDGDPFEKDQPAIDAFKDFRDFFNPSEKNYNSLLSSCFYRQAATMTDVQQNNCPTNQVERGCFGSPPIISISKLTGPAGACSNDSIIPEKSRCKLAKDENGRPINTGVCEGFPYACGTQFGSNRLWIPTKSI